MTIGERIRELRKQQGLTQAELASRLNIPYQSIGQWERGIRNPKPDTIARIAAALNVGLDMFFSGLVTAEEISAEMDMPIEDVLTILYHPEKIPHNYRAELYSKIARVGATLAIELNSPHFTTYNNESAETITSKSLTVEEIKDAFRGKNIEELTEILNALSKEISEQAAQASSSND